MVLEINLHRYTSVSTDTSKSRKQQVIHVVHDRIDATVDVRHASIGYRAGTSGNNKTGFEP